MFRLHVIVFAVMAASVVVVAAPATQPDRPLTCAVLADKTSGLADSPLVALVEARLAQQKGLTLLERGRIDELLKEQELEAALGADAGARRVALGRLLKADMLLLLTKAGKDKALDVVICETNSGLRLRTTVVLLTEKPEEDAVAIEALVAEVIPKCRMSSRAIVAVPPLTGSDFRHEYDGVKQTYARVIEQTLAALPSVLVVEFPEAQAIAKELRLSGGNTVIRELPIYILAKYSVTGEGSAQRWSLECEARRGEELLGERKSDGIPQESVVPRLQTMVLDVLSGRSAESMPVADTAEEVRQLRDRAAMFIRSRDYAEAVAVLHVALLLAPQSPDLHLEMARACEKAMSQLSRKTGYWEPELDGRTPSQDYVARSTLACHYYLLILEHVETWMRVAELREAANVGDISLAESAYYSWRTEHPIDPVEARFQQRLMEVHEQQREMLFRVLEFKAQTGDLSCEVAMECASGADVSRGSGDSARIWRFIETIQDVPELEYEIIGLLVEHASHFRCDRKPIEPTQTLFEELRMPRTSRNVNRLEKLSGRSAKKAAAMLRDLIARSESYRLRVSERQLQELRNERRQVSGYISLYKREGNTVVEERIRRSQLPDHVPPPRPSVLTTEVSLKPVQLRTADGDGPDTVTGWLKCDDQLDVMWSPDTIYAIKAKGSLRVLYRARGRDFEDTTPYHRQVCPGITTDHAALCYDGSYVWAPATCADEPYLLRIDPRTARVRKFTAADGLLPMSGSLCVAPISPGRVFVAAAFGKPRTSREECDRSWYGIVHGEGDAAPEVRVLLQCSQQPSPAPNTIHLGGITPPGSVRGSASNLTLPPRGVVGVKGDTSLESVHIPTCAATLRNPQNKVDLRVLVQEAGRILLVNPEDGSVKALERGFWACPSNLYHANNERVFGVDGFASPTVLRRSRSQKLVWVGFPELKLLPTEISLPNGGEIGNGLGRSYGGGSGVWSMGLDGEVLHVIADQAWWVGLETGRGLRRLSGAFPEELKTFCEIRPSAHYGLVVLAGNGMYPLQPYQVTIDPRVFEALRHEARGSRPSDDVGQGQLPERTKGENQK